jgi:hypothetical protein
VGEGTTATGVLVGVGEVSAAELTAVDWLVVAGEGVGLVSAVVGVLVATGVSVAIGVAVGTGVRLGVGVGVGV